MRSLLGLKYVDVIARAGSIRQAAETLAITPSALNRRLLALEEELGVQIFERLPRGVRPNAAGEILIHHIRNQISDLERVRSQIADLSGVRRGHVAIACSQALLPYFLPQQIHDYRRDHPAVTFGVFPRDRAQAEQALSEFTADLALVFEPVRLAEIQTLMTVRQPIHAVMARDHPLARRKTVRLRECLDHPLALPSPPYGVRTLLEAAAARIGRPLEPAIQSDSFEFLTMCAGHAGLVSFQIEIGLPAQGTEGALTSRPIDTRDVPSGVLHLGQLRGRALPVAAARFADQLSRALFDRFESV
ncbi:MAG: LysR family transcriptional regulator [Alphaproteobacteria bacterium]|nr:LysR family transcriptional regulator [Alphaproteobacteria bacterium]MDX5368629.1 LysR family transcriptional regulator [Alphaproteobacteria bacterium]MDX5463374.1 LysR family transcriptional regulator [Alphaproteobacteria bacterium]